MNKEYINISKIETYLAGIIDNVVSDNTYAGSLPTTINSAWSDMVLIDCANAIADMEAYGRGVEAAHRRHEERGTYVAARKEAE